MKMDGWWIEKSSSVVERLAVLIDEVVSKMEPAQKEAAMIWLRPAIWDATKVLASCLDAEWMPPDCALVAGRGMEGFLLLWERYRAQVPSGYYDPNQKQ